MKYPAGAFGMDRAFETMNETWNARDYNITVESTSEDPRSGKSVVTLVSFSQEEPDPSLFKPPAGYVLMGDAKVMAPTGK